MKNIAGLMKQAAQMQQKMEELQTKLSQMTLEGAAGAGMVTITLNGKGEMKAVRVDPKLLDPNDAEMLQDLVMAAHADAKRKIEAMAAEEMQKLTGGLNLPPGMKLPF